MLENHNERSVAVLVLLFELVYPIYPISNCPATHTPLSGHSAY